MKVPPPRLLYVVVAASAFAVYLGALWNGYALDDVAIVANNPLVHRWSGLWEAFGQPYWPAVWGGAMYRPLAVISYALDWHGGAAWLHATNLVWHAGVSVLVAAIVRRWSGSGMAALIAGMLFALHPVHVEAVANIVGRAELMATLFVLVSVVAALEYDRLGWSLVAFALGLLSKETAAVTPALIAMGWVAGVGHSPSRPRRLHYLGAWAGVGILYWAARWTVLHPYAHVQQLAPVFVGASIPAVRMTGVAAFADFARLLVFPLHLRVDYSPAERTLIATPGDWRFLLGLVCLLGWAFLAVWAWRRGRRVEAFGLAWVGIALLPVANLVFPIGVLVAERTLYLPSVGLALTIGSWVKNLRTRPLAWVAGVALAACAVRTALRVPVWSSTQRVVASVSRDSPRSYVVPMLRAVTALAQHRPLQALADVRVAEGITNGAPRVFILGADAALTLGQAVVADSFFMQLHEVCQRCWFHYVHEARVALARGDTATAQELVTWGRRVDPRAGNGWGVFGSDTTHQGPLR